MRLQQAETHHVGCRHRVGKEDGMSGRCSLPALLKHALPSNACCVLPLSSDAVVQVGELVLKQHALLHACRSCGMTCSKTPHSQKG